MYIYKSSSRMCLLHVVSLRYNSGCLKVCTYMIKLTIIFDQSTSYTIQHRKRYRPTYAGDFNASEIGHLQHLAGYCDNGKASDLFKFWLRPLQHALHLFEPLARTSATRCTRHWP